ncbi:MAG TPA: GNAT family N-acetyltransferase [Gammaproteobacteria bacterium]|nr:GNAT family N-acetyltransferase [Gammaproteobacteria bacterium]
MKIIETERLILRTWKDNDADEFYRINQDPSVIEFLLGPLTLQEVKDFIASVNQQFDKTGYTLFAVEEKSSGKLIGFIGLSSPTWESHFTPCVEIGWRLGSEFWNKGYATEGAKAVLKYGFETVGLKEIVSFTVPANVRSIRVMERIGMVRDTRDDFLHPKLSPEHMLSQHILYRIKRP